MPKFHFRFFQSMKSTLSSLIVMMLLRKPCSQRLAFGAYQMLIAFLLSMLWSLFNPVMAQKEISGKSPVTKIRMSKDFVRGLPPNLYIKMTFEDENNNGILEAGETSRLTLKISNNGKGPAQGVKVSIIDNNPDKALTIGSVMDIAYIMPGNTVELVSIIRAGMTIKTAEHKIDILVSEYFGYDMDPAVLRINTIEYQEPKLVFSGLEVVDKGEGTFALIEDGKIQAGEQVKVKVYLQNIGQNISYNTMYKVVSENSNVFVSNTSGELGNLGVGEVASFWLTLSPNKRVADKAQLPIYLSLTNKHNRGQLINEPLPIKLDQKPPEIVTLDVKVDVTKLTKQVARFEANPRQFETNIGNVINISLVQPSKIKRNNSIGIIMGVEKYQYFMPAPYADNDATLMDKYFKDVLGINKVLVFRSNDVTGHFFDRIFNPIYGDLQKSILKDSTEVFIYYSGHGVPSSDGSKVYLLPSDGRIEALEKHGYDINELYRNLAALQAKQVVIFLDACFTGATRSSSSYQPENLVAMRGALIRPRIEEPWSTHPNYSVFSSSALDQTSQGFDETQNGLFTYYLCAGLQGNADLDLDRKITMEELRKYVGEKVSETSLKIRGRQTPQFNGNKEIILTEY